MCRACRWPSTTRPKSPAKTWPRSGSNRFTFYPGGETWANARLAGITYDGLAEGQALAAHAKNANTFEQMRSFAVTQTGKVAAGEWIDVIRGRDWLAEQVKIEVATQLVNAPGKVPFTDDGIQVLVAGVRKEVRNVQDDVARKDDDAITDHLKSGWVRRSGSRGG